VTGLEQLAGDLASPSKTPALAYIVPDRCHDGSDEPCALGRPAGLQAADSFLRGVVPEIEASAAYKQGGLIAITFDQAPQSGANADSSGCCLSSAYPNLPAGAGPAGTVGASGASGAAGASAPAAGAGSTSATGATGSGGPTGSSGNAGVTGSSGALAGTPPGGGRVGLLLISKYVKPGSVNVISDYNHFSLLASIEDLFGLGRLGYAGSVGLPVFDASVYNAGSH